MSRAILDVLPLLCGALGILSACGSPEPAGPVQGNSISLADRSATLAREEVNGVSRPVLARAITQSLTPDQPWYLTVTAQEGDVEVSFRCPAALLGRRAGVIARLEMNLPAFRRHLWKLFPPARAAFHGIRCPTTTEIPVVVRFAGPHESQKAMFVLRGLETDRVETKIVDLRPDPRLRVALGLSSLPPFASTPEYAVFRVTAADEEGHRITVLHRRLDTRIRPKDREWRFVDVDLEPIRQALGPRLQLVFETRMPADAAARGTLPVWGDPTISWPPISRAEAAHDVVLVSIDTLRADQLGCYGQGNGTSPRLDALALEGTLVETAIAQAPWTLPSHATMMTGLYPCAHGLTAFKFGTPFPSTVVPLAELLRGAGYMTAATTEDLWVDGAAFQRGFAYYWENRDLASPERGTIPQTVGQALAWLRDEAVEPFFLFVHTYQTHEPYVSPSPYSDMFSKRTDPGPPDRDAWAKYDAAIRYTDDSLRPLLSALSTGRFHDGVIVVVTSDHGQALGEHGYSGHGRTLHEEVLRVPLLWWSPGLIARGRRLAGLAGLIDIAPTILDLVGQPIPPTMQGLSIAPALREGGTATLPVSRVLFSENSYELERRAARTVHSKILYDPGDATTFDLDTDPGERSPVRSPEAAAQAAALRAEYERQCSETRSRLSIEAGGESPTPPPDLYRQRRLKALGYVD